MWAYLYTCCWGSLFFLSSYSYFHICHSLSTWRMQTHKWTFPVKETNILIAKMINLRSYKKRVKRNENGKQTCRKTPNSWPCWTTTTTTIQALMLLMVFVCWFFFCLVALRKILSFHLSISLLSNFRLSVSIRPLEMLRTKSNVPFDLNEKKRSKNITLFCLHQNYHWLQNIRPHSQVKYCQKRKRKRLRPQLNHIIKYQVAWKYLLVSNFNE